jgi:hypothetical protein
VNTKLLRFSDLKTRNIVKNWPTLLRWIEREGFHFLEISPFKSDEGELIGKHPGDLTSEILSLKFRAQNPLSAIRDKCLDCCSGNAAEVRKCVVDCALWPFRMGMNPFRKKRELSSAEKRERAERLIKPCGSLGRARHGEGHLFQMAAALCREAHRDISGQR